MAIGRTRSGANEPAVVTLGSDVTTLHLRIRIHPDDVYDAYSVAVRRGATEIWRGRAQAETAGDDRFVIADVPASSLADAKYELAVYGGKDPLGYSTLEVRR